MTQYFVKKVLCLQQKAEKKAPHAKTEAQTMRKTFVIKIKNKLKLLSSPCQFLYFCRICSLTCLVAKFTLCIGSVLVSIDVFRI